MEEQKKSLRTQAQISQEYSQLALKAGDAAFKLAQYKKAVPELEDMQLECYKRMEELSKEPFSKESPSEMSQ